MSETMIQYPHDGSYHFVGDVDKFKDINGLMTGQEWYMKFTRELEKLEGTTATEHYALKTYKAFIDPIAKKAAGIE